MINKHSQLMRRRARVRSKISGTTERPRLTVKITLMNVSAQIIDDTRGVTLVHATTVGAKVKGTMTDKAVFVGETIGAAAKKAGITKIAFDRNGRIYHGRLHVLADAVRKTGMEF